MPHQLDWSRAVIAAAATGGIMRVSAFILACAVAALAGCVKPASELPAANVQTYDVEQARSADHATIKGTYREGTFFGKSTLATFVAAIDGKLEVASGYTTPIPLEPGPHSLVVGYWLGATRRPVPVRLDAEPGRNYLVLQEKGEFDFNLLRGSSYPSYVYIVDEGSGEIVTPRMVDEAEYSNEYYIEPSGPDTAVIRGTLERKGFNEPFSAYVLTIDGKYAPMTPQTALTRRLTKYEAAVRLEPGLRAIGIGLRASSQFAVYPVLLDVEPGAAFVLRYEHGLKRINNDKWTAITVWIEDEKTGAIVWPKTDVPITRLPF